MNNSHARKPLRRAFFLTLLALFSTGLAFFAVMLPLLSRMMTPSLQAGEVADQDYRAPRPVSYVSQVLTEQTRQEAAASIPTIYTPPDTAIARRQMESLRAALAYISSVRQDGFATPGQKLDDLAALESIHLSLDTAGDILALNESRWQSVQQEAIVVLEQVMRSPIRPDRVDEARGSVPTLVSLNLSEQQAGIVADLAAGFIAANSMPSEELTTEARSRASEAVAPINKTFVAGEMVVTRGSVLSPADIEALQALSLGRPQLHWEDPVSAGGLVLLMLAFMLLYLRRSRNPLLNDLRGLGLMAILFITFLLAGRAFLPGHTILPYAYPLAAYGLLVTTLFGAQLALVSSLPLAILTAYGMPNTLELTLFYAMGALFGVLALGRARRLSAYMLAGVAMLCSNVLIILVFRLPGGSTDWIGLATLSGASLFNGLAASSLTVILQYFLAQFLGLTTPMQLMELTRPDHPLLQTLLQQAPGTYQHSLQVANLAEQGGEQVGADPLLIRVGALYHDAGKVVNPIFFIENQPPGTANPHDQLDPESSAQIIIRHVPAGVELARKHRLPRRIVSFVSEHHGTLLTSYQYVNAVKAAGGDESQVDAEKFRYPGPPPQSRETAILMLADGCEARVRAEKPQEEEHLRNLIKQVIDDRVASGQLDATDLTLNDLRVLLESFTATLRGIYHPRVVYPVLESATAAPAPQSLPAPAASEDTVPSPARPQETGARQGPAIQPVDTTSPAS